MKGALRCEGLTAGYGADVVVRDLTFAVPVGRVTAFVGPNGCGKSTVLRTIAQLHAPSAGRVMLGDEDLSAVPRATLARALALLPQSPVAPPDLTVRELVAYGRFPHRRWFERASEADLLAVETALRDVDLGGLAHRLVRTLSGGQRQRAWIAMALAQETENLLLDEPTSALDLTRQVEVLEVLRRLQRERRGTVVVAMHDLNLAARWADHVLVLHEGRLVAAGSPRDVLTADLIAAVYGVHAYRLVDPAGDVPVFAVRGMHTEDSP